MSPFCEREFVRRLSLQMPTLRGDVELGIGDDMAILRLDAGEVLITADMLLDGVHFDSSQHTPELIGYKSVACSLSDCAAMAVRPVAATLSIALPRIAGGDVASRIDDASGDVSRRIIDASGDVARRIIDASGDFARRIALAAGYACDAFECTLAGGDTTRWTHPLAIDVSVIATPYPGIRPVRRSGARPGDGLYVTGPLGGSLLGKHLTFVPRIAEARMVATELGDRLHALMDISDGLGIDLDRMCEASGVGAVLDESYLLEAASEAARKAADQDGRSVLDHALSDGEDYELLIAGQADNDAVHRLHLTRVGEIVAGSGLKLRAVNGTTQALTPTGYEHF